MTIENIIYIRVEITKLVVVSQSNVFHTHLSNAGKQFGGILVASISKKIDKKVMFYDFILCSIPSI